jgi:hypothetical protein
LAISNILKHPAYLDKDGVIKKLDHAPVFWKEYANHYFDGKYIDIWKLANPDQPSQSKRLKYSEHIRIYDVFGFFGSSLSAVVDSMVQNGRATDDEAAFIRKMKGQRENFGSEDIDHLKTYTEMELRLLARMMTDLRKGFDETGLHLQDWHGSGAAAQALIEAKKLKAHYGPDIAALNITPQQRAAHHAYFGGRIELLKQGYIENVVLHCYDIASAYPAGMVTLPSLAGGKWVNLPGSRPVRLRNSARLLRRLRRYRCSKSGFNFRYTKRFMRMPGKPFSLHSIRCPIVKRAAEFCSRPVAMAGTCATTY